jgi:predicted nucleotidyltransferase
MNTPVLNLDQARTRIAEASDEIRDLGVMRLALFGSVLRGTARPDSDIDLLVSFFEGEKTFVRFVTLCESLERILGRRVELVTTEALSTYIGPKFLAEAQDVLRAA